ITTSSIRTTGTVTYLKTSRLKDTTSGIFASFLELPLRLSMAANEEQMVAEEEMLCDEDHCYACGRPFEKSTPVAQPNPAAQTADERPRPRANPAAAAVATDEAGAGPSSSGRDHGPAPGGEVLRAQTDPESDEEPTPKRNRNNSGRAAANATKAGKGKDRAAVLASREGKDPKEFLRKYRCTREEFWRREDNNLCWYCASPDHRAADCPNKPDDADDGNGKGKRPFKGKGGKGGNGGNGKGKNKTAA
ncbi:hypothetical protein Agub_g11821, partial [Astrephomene gubernaculifera]